MKKLILLFVVATVSLSSFNVAASTCNKETTFNVTTMAASPFCKLIQKGDYEAVKELVELGEDVNRKSTGLTPLMFAARHNRADIAQLLIDNGAKIKIKAERTGFTALKLAEISNAKETYKVIKMALIAQKTKKRNKRDVVVSRN